MSCCSATGFVVTRVDSFIAYGRAAAVVSYTSSSSKMMKSWAPLASTPRALEGSSTRTSTPMARCCEMMSMTAPSIRLLGTSAMKMR